MQELFKGVPGISTEDCEYKYMASDKGNIIINNYNHTGFPKMATLKKHHKGYYVIHTTFNNKWTNFMVHSLVAMAFPEICGEWFEGAVVHHLNGVKTDNRPENLIVMTAEEHNKLHKTK